jgi:hypothetical protein
LYSEIDALIKEALLRSGEKNSNQPALSTPKSKRNRPKLIKVAFPPPLMRELTFPTLEAGEARAAVGKASYL